MRDETAHEWGTQSGEGVDDHPPPSSTPFIFHQMVSYNPSMLALTLVHLLQPWRILHWIHIYDWSTFIVVVFLGFFQALIAWYSGYLAVRGIEDKLPKTARNRHMVFFALLGLGLLLMTALVGILNDGNQYQADARANSAIGREENLQKTLDHQSQLIGKADADIANTGEMVKRGGSAGRIISQLEQVRRTLSGAQATKAREQDSANRPFANMSNSELKNSAMAFGQQLRSEDFRMYGVEDRLTAARNHMRQSRNPTYEQTQLVSADTDLLNNTLNQIIQHDVPLVAQYRSELLIRLGPNPKLQQQIPSPSADIGSVNQFLTASSDYLDNLAYTLPDSNKLK